MPSSSIKIVSGGQAGADRAALDAALACGVSCGGWCPEGRLAEDGRIADSYPIVELPGAGYRQRTRRNVQDSDGTAIFSFGPPEGGRWLRCKTVSCSGSRTCWSIRRISRPRVRPTMSLTSAGTTGSRRSTLQGRGPADSRRSTGTCWRR